MINKQFVVIGLGRFGYSIAKTLHSLDYDVLAIDRSEDIVQQISDEVTHAVQLDATDENALKSLGVRNFDVAIVAIGEDIQASIMVTLLLKELGVKYIIAKAQNEKHQKVLEKIGADRVILPEKEMGIRIANNLSTTNILDYIELSPDYSIMEVKALKEWENKTLKELRLRSTYGINIVAIKRGEDVRISPLAEDIIMEDDIIITIGTQKTFNKLKIL